MIGLGEAISSYQAALDDLPPRMTPEFRSKVMIVFVARDALAHVLADGRPITSEALSRITELDQRLKASAMQIDTSIGRATLASWREAIQPPAVAWWWSLDQHAAAAEAQPHPLW